MAKSSKDIQLSELKDLISQLNMTIKSLNETIARQQQENDNLKAEMAWLKQKLFGSCFLQALFGQSCKTFLDIIASPNWTKLQSLDWQLSCQPHSHCRPYLVVTA